MRQFFGDGERLTRWHGAIGETDALGFFARNPAPGQDQAHVAAVADQPPQPNGPEHHQRQAAWSAGTPEAAWRALANLAFRGSAICPDTATFCSPTPLRNKSLTLSQ